MSFAVDREEVGRLKRLVADKLKSGRRSWGFGLKIVNVVVEPDGWLDFVVEPTSKSVGVYESCRAMANVEVDLRKEGVENVLLVPDLPDFAK